MRIAFVSAPGGSLFMEELLADVATTVRADGVEAYSYSGLVEEVIDPDTVAVIIPHEYLALAPQPERALLRRTIGFGVEHPGTVSFERAAAAAPLLGAAFEISNASAIEMRSRGVQAQHFVLGAGPHWGPEPDFGGRDIDVLHLGTADETRVENLAPILNDLESHRTHIRLVPHEWMNRDRPDFAVGARKYALLRRSRMLLNLHREGSHAFEWVRALDAIRSGCAVLTAPSLGLHPLVPGEHILVARPQVIGRVAVAALDDGDRVADIARNAYELVKTTLDMTKSAQTLIEHASNLAHIGLPARLQTPAPAPQRESQTQPPNLAPWVPTHRELPIAAAESLEDRARLVVARACEPIVWQRPSAGDSDVDVVCVRSAGDGPVPLTDRSFDGFRVHYASNGGGPLPALGASRTEFPDAVGRGYARNRLIETFGSEFVCVIDAGDEIVGRGMYSALTALREDPELDIAYPLAVDALPQVVNALIPELRRLQSFAYLGRGFIVRRRFLETMGGFSESAATEAFLDHDFWVRALQHGARAELVPELGVRLWSQAGVEVTS